MKKICIGETGEYDDHSFPVAPNDEHEFICTECIAHAAGEIRKWLLRHWESLCCDPGEIRRKADLAHKANYGNS